MMDQELIDFTSHADSANGQSVFASTTASGISNRSNSSSPNNHNNNRASVSPNYYDDNNDDNNNTSALAYADKRYVRTPPVGQDEEESLLLDTPSRTADPHDPLNFMGSTNPLEGNFRDEFEDEMDEIEMQQDTSNVKFINLNELQQQAAHQKSLRKRRRRQGCMCICLLLMVGGIVAGVVLGTSNNNNNTSDKPSHANRQQAVPKASSLLKLWCAEGYDLVPGQTEISTDIPKDCEVACLKGECCWNPNSIYECTEETKQECSAYESPCRIMVTNNNDNNENDNDNTDEEVETLPAVPQAPATLKTTCFMVGTSYRVTQACHEQCHLGDCCWNTTSTAQCSEESKKDNCKPYEQYCSFMNDHNASPQDQPLFPVANDEIENLCSESTMAELGSEGCQTECAKAECCWKVGTVNCALSVSDDMCKDYTSACAKLNTLDVNNNNNNNNNDNGEDSTGTSLPFPVAPSGLEVYCNPAEMEKISLHICQQKCEPAKCCWGIEEEVCPPNVGGEVCQPYAKSCAILNELQTYPGNDENNNEQQSGSINLGVGGEVAVAPTDLAQRCDHDNIAGTENGGNLLIECERDCLAAACCWHPNMESCSSNEHCSAYEKPCSMFVGLFDSGSESSVAAVPTAPSTLSTVCSPDVLSTDINEGKFIVECEKECLAASCCWKQNAANSCPDAAECGDYMEPCGNNLVAALAQIESGSGSTITQPPETSGSGSEEAKAIQSACNDQVAFFLKTKCEEVCLPGSCCYEDTEACELGIECDIYAPCYVLHNRRQLRHLSVHASV